MRYCLCKDGLMHRLGGSCLHQTLNKSRHSNDPLANVMLSGWGCDVLDAIKFGCSVWMQLIPGNRIWVTS